MWLEKIEVLSEFNEISVIVRLFLALVIGALLGVERERKQRPAGLRTYILVCVGSALATITNLYMCKTFGNVDPSRIPAQIVSGIGFLGAGTILVTKVYRIKGLTTAAGLWCCAAVGIATGAGFYTGAILTGILIVVSLRLFSIVDKRLARYNKYMHCYVEYRSREFVKGLICYAKEKGFHVSDLEITKDSNDGGYFATFQLKITDPQKRAEVVLEMQDLPECIAVEEIE